ncbi:MAG: hypothetical protein P8010_07995, partial [Desulfosarcinaceae bacterium]
MDNQRMNVSYCLYVVAIFLALTGSVRAEALNYDGKKILFVNSYHKGTPWSDGIYRAVENTLR